MRVTELAHMRSAVAPVLRAALLAQERTASDIIGIDIGGLHRLDSKERHLAVLRFYLDESGSQTMTPAFAMAGHVATERQWKLFAREWQRALDDAEIDAFHATDFFSRRGRHNQKGGRYEEWSDEKHLRFARRFTAIAESERHTLMGVGRGVEVSAYRDLLLPESIFRGGTPHNRFTPILFCAQTCLEFIAKFLRPRIPRSEEIAVVFEGGPGIGEVLEWCLYLKGHTSWATIYCGFGFSTKSALPLQAADLLVHETWRFITEQVNPTGRPLRRSLRRLTRGERVNIGLSTREQFEKGIPLIRQFSDDPTGSTT